MKDYSIEQMVMAVAPKSKPNADFTKSVMGAIMGLEPRQKHHTYAFAWLTHVPKFAVVALVLALTLAVTGTAYAVYKALWVTPTVHTLPAQQNQYGRQEMVAGFENCTNSKEQESYEIKKGSTITPEDVPKILQAKCEKAAIQAALGSDFGSGNLPPPQNEEGVHDQTTLAPAGAKVIAITDTSLTLVGDVNTQTDPFMLDAATKYIVDGKIATRQDIAVGDAVLVHKTVKIKTEIVRQDANGTSKRGYQVGPTKINYVIKLGLPYEYYTPLMQNQIVERTPCLGNPMDTCIETPRVPLYENDNAITTGDEGYVLQGVVQSHSSQAISIKTSSGRIVIIKVTRNPIAYFNTTLSHNYDGIKIDNGDSIRVDYWAGKGFAATTIQAYMVDTISVQLDLIQKNDPLIKY